MNFCLAPTSLLDFWWRSNLLCDNYLMAPAYWIAPSLQNYWWVFLATVLLEAPFFAMAGHVSGAGARRGLLALLIGNLATHPAIHFLLFPNGAVLSLRVYQMILAAETFALAAELLVAYALLRKCRWRPALIYIAAANLFTWQMAALF